MKQAFLILFVALVSPMVFAQALDLGLFAGNVTTTVDPGESSPSVSEIGASLGLKLPVLEWMNLGVEGTYTSLNQSTDPTAITGNRSGRRYNGSALLDLHSGGLSLKLTSPITGKYEMPYNTYLGSPVTYENVSGGRASLLFQYSPIWLGVFYEQLTYGKANMPLTTSLKATNVGLILEFHFFDDHVSTPSQNPRKSRRK